MAAHARSAEPANVALRDTVSRLLHTNAQRLTPTRQHIVDVLAAASGPLTIPEILTERDGLAQSSVYRNLVVLEEAGVVHRMMTRDEFARYELAEDLTEHHHHLVCSNCGTVDDFTVTAALELELERALRRVASKHGFASASHRLDLVGTCARCNSAS